MPVYNTNKFALERCLKSLSKQTLDDIEFIIIDNGCNVFTNNIISQYKSSLKNLKLIKFSKNIGYSQAMNAGLKKARGEYIGFCDSDDYVDSNYYENLYNLVKYNKSDIITCGYFEEHKDKTIKHTLKDSRNNNLFDIIENGAVWNKLFNRNFIYTHNIHFSKKNLSVYADNFFLIQAVFFAKSVIVDKNDFYHYVIYDFSTIHGISLLDQKQSTYDVLDEAFKTLPTNIESESLIKFLFKSLPIQTLTQFPDSMNYITKTVVWKEIYNSLKRYNSPTFMQKMFSITKHPITQNIRIRILGIRKTRRKL